jgi:H+-transporting ATPase
MFFFIKQPFLNFSATREGLTDEEVTERLEKVNQLIFFLFYFILFLF